MSIEQAYNQWVEQYDNNVNRTRDLDQAATIDMLSGISFSNVLELGCGTGKNTTWLATRANKVTALDFSEGMLARAREKVQRDQVTFARGDLRHPWPVPNGSVNLITCNLVLEHIENLDGIFMQTHEKLSSGGKFFISELHPFRQYTGSKAKFETAGGSRELEVYTHHISDFTGAAESAHLRLLKLKEWFDPEGGLPRLITFLFEK
jgi:ubiquinone/menaquinone biosynthesis C-methylase UbiE